MIRSEYLRFLQSLTAPTITDGVRKIANLVLNHLEILQGLSTSHGQRIKKIAEIAKEEWYTLSEVIDIKEEETEQVASMNRLARLKVGPFRGFSRQESFDLDSRLVLIYGPNGTGKSSFCEALEFGLLGNVAEAESKRIKSTTYLTNAHVNSFQLPIVEALDAQSNVYTLEADESLYRFCFIEKNRIDNFSRIAAQLPAKQNELISTLFGMDSFNDFVQNFTNDMDDRYIDLIGIKQQELLQKQTALSGQYTIVENSKKSLIDLSEDESSLAERYKPGFTFPELIKETSKEISFLERDMDKPLPTKTGLTLQLMIAKKEIIDELSSRQQAQERDMNTLRGELSFKQLYSAILAMKEDSATECPACKTPIGVVQNNPFELARRELERLNFLSELEESLELTKCRLSEELSNVYQFKGAITCGLDEQHPLALFFAKCNFRPTLEWWGSMFNENGGILWDQLLGRIQQLEQFDKHLESNEFASIEKKKG